MRRLALPAALLAVTATVVALALAPAEPIQPSSPAAVSAPAPKMAPAAGESADDAPVSRRARYAMTHRTTYSVDGDPQPPIEVRATWAVDPAGHRVRLSDVELSTHPALPSAAALAGSYRLHAPRGVLEAVLAPAGGDRQARQVFAGLAAAFWVTPGDGARWTAEEEDTTGRFVARYTRRSGQVIKTIERYLGIHAPDGLDPAPAQGMRTGGRTVFTTDARGLVEAVVDTTLAVRSDETDTRIDVRIEATLRRVDGAPDPIAARGLLPYRFGDFVDAHAQRRRTDEVRVAGADAATLLSEFERVGQLDRTVHQAERSALLKRMSALVRLDPAAADRFADAIVEKAAAGESVGLLTGALASADEPAATDALAGTLEQLEGPALHGAMTTLGLAHAPTVASMETLQGQLDGAYDEAAAMAMGTQARALADDAPDEAASAVELLVTRCAATPIDGREGCLLALGNTGDRRALPLLVEAAQSPGMRPTALWAMRFVPGDDVDAALRPWVLDPGPAGVAALRAVAHRDPAGWVSRLTLLRPIFEAMGQTGARQLDRVDGLLARWGA